MNYDIPPKVLEMYFALQDAGYEVFFVGGSVRGLLMEREITDWDFATSATPEEIQSVFSHSYYDNPYGTVGVPYEDALGEGRVVEITTYRKDGVYRDMRRPEAVSWGKNIEEDLARRDFTINAMALQVVREANSPARDELDSLDQKNKFEFVDPFSGREDIERGMVRAVGDAQLRFREDALRMMRAVRIATQLNFEIEKGTLDAIISLRENIEQVAWERVSIELIKILASDHPAEGIRLLDKVGLLELILPEVTHGKGVSMVRPGRHHTTDVYEHSLLSLEYTPSTDPIVRLASLIHDIGKPQTASLDQEGLVVFYNHEVVGAHMAKAIADRLRLSKKDRDRLFLLVRWHMFTVDDTISEKAIRRFIRRVGVENIRDMIDLRIGDRLGSGAAHAESWRLKKFQERITSELNPPFAITDLAIDGSEVMSMLHISPGPQVGQILRRLFEEVDEDLSLNNKEYLKGRVYVLYEEISHTD